MIIEKETEFVNLDETLYSRGVKEKEEEEESKGPIWEEEEEEVKARRGIFFEILLSPFLWEAKDFEQGCRHDSWIAQVKIEL